MMNHVTTDHLNLPIKYCLIILILLFRDSVRWFLNEIFCSSHHWLASLSETPHWIRMNPHMLFSFMLKSNDASGPCRNFTCLKSTILTAQEKFAACPCFAAFMPNSPMPMLDVCDWLLLISVFTTFGGPFLSSLLSFLSPLFSLSFPLLKWELSKFIFHDGRLSFLPILGRMLFFYDFRVCSILFFCDTSGMFCVDFCVLKTWRAPVFFHWFPAFFTFGTFCVDFYVFSNFCTSVRVFVSTITSIS